ncbi:MAG: hypothetical protein R2860_05315 [Desulfobacterales bacterium]
MCAVMLEDAVKVENLDKTLRVMDVSEIVMERVGQGIAENKREGNEKTFLHLLICGNLDNRLIQVAICLRPVS